MPRIRFGETISPITTVESEIEVFGEHNPKNPAIFMAGPDIIIRQKLDNMDIAPQILREEYEKGNKGEHIKITKKVEADGSRIETLTFKRHTLAAVIEFSNGRLDDVLTTRARVAII